MGVAVGSRNSIIRQWRREALLARDAATGCLQQPAGRRGAKRARRARFTNIRFLVMAYAPTSSSRRAADP
eukprot:1621005-Lingulodinium_polyedra.AAC.1